jgi:hypothetical protein
MSRGLTVLTGPRLFVKRMFILRSNPVHQNGGGIGYHKTIRREPISNISFFLLSLFIQHEIKARARFGGPALLCFVRYSYHTSSESMLAKCPVWGVQDIFARANVKIS